MKIKSLLLGSAAALVAVSGAQAADAIVVEPEPVEYVRVCDMYGAGYFYIPGTETCLRISGHVRIDYRVDQYHNTPGNDVIPSATQTSWDDTSDHSTLIRGRVGFTAQNETEYGTLGSDIVFTMYRANNKDAFSNIEGYHSQLDALPVGGLSGLTKATINLAGFRVGYDGVAGSAWHRYGGYGYYNARMDGFYYEGGSAGQYTAAFFEYGGSVGDVNYVIGIQDSNISGTPGAPDPYIGLTTSMGGLSLGAVVYYDSNGGDDNGVATGDGGVAYKVRADYDLSSMIPGGSIGAWWMADHGQTDYVKGHVWGVTMQANLTDKLVAFGGYSVHDFDDDATGDANTATDWTVGVRWNVVSGLYVQAEWNKQMQEDGFDLGTAANPFLESSRDRFNLRILRSF